MSESFTDAMVTVSVIIVSYNTREMTLRCLETLYKDLGALPAEVIVVDNASSDGSAAAIAERYPKVCLIKNPNNAGFGAANNLAMQRARGLYFLLLNSDAFPSEGAIPKLVDYLESHTKVGVVGPRLLNEDGTLQLSCFRFPSPLQAWAENLWITRMFTHESPWGDFRGWDHDEEREVDFVIGACFLVRREMYEQIGGFDERFFMYQEEADWQKRIHDGGWKVVFVPQARVVHLGGGSGKDEPARMNQQFFESLDSYALKHHGLGGFLLIRAAMLVGCTLRTVLWSAMALAPSWRSRATAKMRQHAWLVGRQLLTGLPSNRLA